MNEDNGNELGGATDTASTDTTSTDTTRTSAPGRVTITLADLARDVVTASAPKQLELLKLVTAQWETGAVPASRHRGWLGGSVGSDIDPALISEIVYPVLTGALAQVLGGAAVRGWRRRWWRRRRPAELPTVPQVRVTIEIGQLDAVRTECLTYAMALGLSKARALLLADAVYGALRRAIDDSEGSS